MINIKEIIISIKNNKIIFSYKEELVKILSFNDDNDNIVSNNEIVFNEEYIINNIKIISNFINGIATDENIDSVYVDKFDIVPLVIKILSNVKAINNLIIEENKELSYEILELLLKCKYIKNLECYNAPINMIDELDKKDIKVDFRLKYNSNSNFIINNKLYSYSKMYYKDKIDIGSIFNEEDIKEFVLFLKTSRYLKIINIYNFSFELINQIVNCLEENNIRNILIHIHANNENSDFIQGAMEYLKTLDKIYKKKLNIDFKIKYSEEYKEKNSIKQVSMNIIVGCCFILNFLMLFGFVYSEYNNYMTKKSIEKIKKISKVDVSSTSTNDVIEENESTEENIDVTQMPEQEKHDNINTAPTLTENYDNLLKINSDTVGWLKVNNTNINYPVVHTSDNDYYLKHGFYKNNTINGWVFMDFRNNPKKLGRNTIIYGHNLKNGTMFGSLRLVTTPNWYNNENNYNIIFNTVDNKMTWKIFSIYVIDVTNDYMYTYFENDEDFANFLNKIKSRSFRNFNVDVNANDKILTLSTCQSNGTKRLVVHAKLVT